MRAKELWEARWRVVILNPIGWLLALTMPFLFGLLQKGGKNVPGPALALLHYPTMAFGWFREDLPELLLLYVIIWSVAQITREWQTGSIEFLGQLPLTAGQVALLKGLWGSAEISLVSLLSSAVLWIVSIASGHHLPAAVFIVSSLLITVGFIAMVWLISLLAWALHSTYGVIILALAVYIVSVIAHSVRVLRPYSPITYMTNANPAAHLGTLWVHLGVDAAAALVLAWAAVAVAGRQEFGPNHGRDQV